MRVNRPAICRPRVPANRPRGFDVDAGVDERRGQPFGEVLQLVGHLGAGAGGQVEVVQLIDQDELHAGVGGGVADRVDDVGDVRPAR